MYEIGLTIRKEFPSESHPYFRGALREKYVNVESIRADFKLPATMSPYYDCTFGSEGEEDCTILRLGKFGIYAVGYFEKLVNNLTRIGGTQGACAFSIIAHMVKLTARDIGQHTEMKKDQITRMAFCYLEFFEKLFNLRDSKGTRFGVISQDRKHTFPICCHHTLTKARN
jgi:hypothetical protein